MKVRELIRHLQSLDQEARVVVDGYEGGYDDLDEGKISMRKIHINAYGGKSTMTGAHDDVEMTEPPIWEEGPDTRQIENAVVLSRNY